MEQLDPISPLFSPRSQSHRAAACTHTRLTRLYDPYGCIECSVCKAVPNLGWLYRCTQETQGNLPDSDFVDIHQGILKVVRAEEAMAQDTVPGSTTRPALGFRLVSFGSSDTEDGGVVLPTTPDAVDNSEQVTRRRLSQIVVPKSTHSACGFRVCPNCRPAYCERAWQSLSSIVDSVSDVSSEHERNNRRLADAAILARMNLRGARYYSMIDPSIIGEPREPSVSEYDDEDNDDEIVDSTESAGSDKEHSTESVDVLEGGYEADCEDLETNAQAAAGHADDPPHSLSSVHEELLQDLDSSHDSREIEPVRVLRIHVVESDSSVLEGDQDVEDSDSLNAMERQPSEGRFIID